MKRGMVMVLLLMTLMMLMGGVMAQMCLPDMYNGNQQLATAFPISIPSSTPREGRLCTGDEKDYFKLEPIFGNTFTIRLEYSQDDGDIDMRVVNGDSFIIGTSGASTGVESITVEILTSDEYYLEIYFFGSVAGSTSGCEYSFTVELPTETVPQTIQVTRPQGGGGANAATSNGVSKVLLFWIVAVVLMFSL